MHEITINNIIGVCKTCIYDSMLEYPLEKNVMCLYNLINGKSKDIY